MSKWIATITVNNGKETVEGDMIKSKSGWGGELTQLEWSGNTFLRR